MNLFRENFHQIIDGLYLSDFAGAYNISHMLKYKITHILVCARELSCKFPETFVYLHIDLDDTPTSTISIYLKMTSDFIHNALTSGGTVLVHCAMGISRSPSIVIAYLLSYEQLTYSEAYELVHFKHRSTRPMPNFTKELKNYEKALKGSASQTCVCEII